MTTHDPFQTRFECPFCGLEFDDEYELDEHLEDCGAKHEEDEEDFKEQFIIDRWKEFGD